MSDPKHEENQRTPHYEIKIHSFDVVVCSSEEKIINFTDQLPDVPQSNVESMVCNAVSLGIKYLQNIAQYY